MYFASVCALTCVPSAHGGQRSMLELLELELSMVGSNSVMLGAEPRSSARASHASNPEAPIPPACWTY